MGIVAWMLVIIFLLVIISSYAAIAGSRKLGRLEDVVALPKNTLPKVSVIFSALNEEGTIELALRSLLSVDYPDMEIIAVNDRSTDKTPAILDRLAEQSSCLRVVHIENLPDTWLGKSHALQMGAQYAQGKYIIFTDADVVFDKNSIVRAVSYCEQQQLDHLTLMPTLIAKNAFLQLLLVNFSIGMLLRFKPWLVSSRKDCFMGVGAFNLVRRSAYNAIGQHQVLALTVIDDIALGKLIKDKGFHSDVLVANELVSVEWYTSPMSMFHGLQKNTFAAFDFQLAKLIAASIFIAVVRIFPWVCLFFTKGASQWLAVLTLLPGILLYSYFLTKAKWKKYALLFAPVAGVFELAMWWSASLRVIYQKGVYWRGTFYPLEMLKEHQYSLSEISNTKTSQ